MFLSDLSIKQPVLATMLAVSLVTLGLFSYNKLSIDQFPDVELPVLTVQTIYQGASPETVEREVTKRIEESINTVSGVKHIQSTSTEGLSVVIVEFRLGVSINTAQQDAQAKINAIRSQFPTGIEEPVVQKIDFNALPVVSVAVESPTADIKTLSTLAEKTIKKRLENVQGVGQITIVGLARREIQIFLDRNKLKAYGLTYPQVSLALQRENMDVPAGKLEQGRQEPLVRVAGKLRSLESFDKTVVAYRGASPIYLPMIARVVDGVEERNSAALIDGKPGLALDIVKQSGANTVEVADGVNAAIDEINSELPSHIRLRKVVDASTFIRDSVEDVKMTLVLGGLLTVLIVFLFLNSWRSTAITGLALPVSVISTFIIMYALHFTLNILTLMGLSLAIGLLIDDAIVVRENIVRHMHAGADHFTAAREATAEIGLAVMATTFTIMAVFIPVAFMGGIMGRFFYQFGITVGFAVLVSLYVSFTLDPMLSSRWYDPAADPNVPKSWFGRGLARLNEQLDRLQNVIAGMLGWSLRHRFLVMTAVTALVLGSLTIFGLLGSEFMPGYDQGQFQVTYKAEPGISLERSSEIARELETDIRLHPGVSYTYTTVGGSSGRAINEGAIWVGLKPLAQRDHYKVIVRQIRSRLVRYRSIKTAITEASQVMGGEKPIQITLRGADIATLEPLSRKLLDIVRHVPGATDVDTSEQRAQAEVRVAVDRTAASDLGLDLGTVASTMRGLVAGEVVSQFEDPDGDSYDVRLRLERSSRSEATDLLGLDLPGKGGLALIPASQVAHLETGEAPSKIRHFDLMREIRIDANAEGRSLGDVVNDIKAGTAGMGLPPGYRIDYTGETENMTESFGYVVQALGLAIILIYAILASQFRSFMQPFAIMLSLPLSLAGVGGMLYFAHDTLNMMSMIGVILLMGLVTKNAILLVDFANVQRREGVPRTEALITAARVRLRPILMTTLAMIFGMMPLVLELGAGAELRAPMARAVVGGLITSTLLTLVVVPIVYTFLDDLGGWFVRRWHTNTPDHAREAEESATV
jgi:hydrophobic/amphiphilic exporter-1 (mainly G- bacteria), HAE1 family